MQTKFTCDNCYKEVNLLETPAWIGIVPILCSDCQVLVKSQRSTTSRALIIIYLLLRWLIAGGVSLLIILMSSLAIYEGIPENRLDKIGAGLILLSTGLMLLHVAIYGKSSRLSTLKQDRDAHKILIKSLWPAR
jgi:hypothetical protein